MAGRGPAILPFQITEILRCHDKRGTDGAVDLHITSDIVTTGVMEMSGRMLGLTKGSLLTAAFAAAAILALSAPAEAQRRSRPQTEWCLRGPTGGMACLYNTFEQCRKAAHGTGGSCRRNPHFKR
jgi:hypothetical protein